MTPNEKIKASVLGVYFLVIFLLGAVLFPFYEKGTLELTMNQLHHPIWDVLFSKLTHLGDGLILIIPFVLLAFHKAFNLILFVFSSFIHLILVHIGKYWVFPGMPRPAEFLKEVAFYEVPGIDLHHWGSFPSGHTTTAFMLASCTYLLLTKKFHVHFLLMGIAFFIGLSRVYLMQHFFMDI